MPMIQTHPHTQSSMYTQYVHMQNACVSLVSSYSNYFDVHLSVQLLDVVPQWKLEYYGLLRSFFELRYHYSNTFFKTNFYIKLHFFYV